jgi:hypothetical protein
MPLRFTRRLRLFPGARLNLSKRGASVSRRSRVAAVGAGRRRGAVPALRAVIDAARRRLISG